MSDGERPEDELPEDVQGFLDMLGIRGSANRNTITAHYGVKEGDYHKQVQEMFITFIRMPKTSDVIDIFFSELSAEQRVKVLAFSTAMMEMKLYTQMLHKANTEF